MYHVMSMINDWDKGGYRYVDWGRFDDLNTAIEDADSSNKQQGFQGRYFVVSEQEYQEYWKEVVS